MPSIERLVFASGNAGKLREVRALLEDLPIEVLSQAEFQCPDAEETGLTFVENALIKARQASRHCSLPAFADDSGLVVDALDGAPGVRSARYAGASSDDAQNNDRLLEALQGRDDSERRAHFHCTIAYLRHAEDPEPGVFSATWSGRIGLEPKGDKGFGYDPLFVVSDLGRTAAELETQQKNRCSHRAQAIAKFRRFLESAY